MQTVERYLSYLKGMGRSPDTIKRYANILKRLDAAVGSDYSKKSIADFWYDNFSELSASARAVAYNALNGYFEWLINGGSLDKNPLLTNQIPKAKPAPSEPKPIPESEIPLLLERIRALPLKLRTLFTLIYEAGLRVSEALSIDIEHVSIVIDAVYVRVRGKGGKVRVIPLFSDTESFKLIPAYLKYEDRAEGPLFCSNYNRRMSYKTVIDHWTEKVTPKYNMHRMRHTQATNMVNNGVPYETIRRFLGHSSFDMVNRYAQYADKNFKEDIRRHQAHDSTDKK